MKKCPICEGELIETESGNLYCDKDDVTYTMHKGKIKVQEPPVEPKKGKIQELEENQMEIGNKVEKIMEKLFGTKDDDLWM